MLSLGRHFGVHGLHHVGSCHLRGPDGQAPFWMTEGSSSDVDLGLPHGLARRESWMTPTCRRRWR